MKQEIKNIIQNKKLLAIICIVVCIVVLVIVFAIKNSNDKNSDNLQYNKQEIKKVVSNAEVKMLKGDIYCPKDATVVNDKKEKGIVIKDSNQNEWVWIEVPKKVFETAGPAIEDFNNENCLKIRYDLKNYVTDVKRKDQKNVGEDYWLQIDDNGIYSKYDPLVSETYDRNIDWLKRTQGCGMSYWEYSELYTNMLKSIYENGGFYIGRYETGYKAEAEKDSKDSKNINQNPVIQKNVIPYSNVKISDAIGLSKKLSTNKLTSSVIFNIQWDLALKYMSVNKNGIKLKNITENSTDLGNYSNNKNKYNKLVNTGLNNDFSVLNTFDMAGNIEEFTLGFADDNNPCVKRGGNYKKDGKSQSASYIESCKNTDIGGFRCTLFK